MSLSIITIMTSSQATVITVERELGNYWRTTYDILVRPPGTRSPIEEKYGLVEANHLSGIFGGITLEQYEAIKSIPGVDVAAPIAMLGYIQNIVEVPVLDHQLKDPGAYALKMYFIAENEDGSNNKDLRVPIYYFYIGPDAGQDITMHGPILATRLFVNPSVPPFSHLEFPFLIAGIDPSQEAALIGLNQALVEGEYLSSDDPFSAKGSAIEISAAALVNATTYISITQQTELRRLDLPHEASTLENILDHGGIEYLTQLHDTEIVAVQRLNSDDFYHLLIENLREKSFSYTFASDLPSQINYKEIPSPFPYDGLVVEIVLPEEFGYLQWPAYRTTNMRHPPDFNTAFRLDVKGIYDIRQIPRPADVNRVPLETYFPPISILRYDEQSKTLYPPRLLGPTLNIADYIQSPPLVLTNLNSARMIWGDDAISAIRVRVALEGCPSDYLTCPLTPAAQRKIETIAGEIATRTGLDVDIMVGSSPTKVLVHVPGIGCVEEQWIQKNVTVSYQKRVQTGHMLLLGTLLGIGGLFTLDLAWAEVVARRRTIALQKALGWRSATVFRQILGEIVLIGTAAALLGSLTAWGVPILLGWEQQPSPALLIGVPLLVVGLATIGDLYPAWLAAGVPPVVGLRGEIRVERFGKHPRSRRGGLLRYAWQGLTRRWSRTALGSLTAALSAALLVLLLGVTVDRQGAMSGTLLGEFILVRIEGYHYVIVGIGFGLAALSLANSLLAGVLERRREIGVLKAVGWRTSTVARLFLVEGMFLGGLGGLAGIVLGLSVFVGLYEIVSPSLAWIGLAGVGVPVGVGLLAALYPARVAARVPPAEAVRYE